MSLGFFLAALAYLAMALIIANLIYTNSTQKASYERKFNHQRDELRKAAVINAELRASRDHWRKLAEGWQFEYRYKQAKAASAQFNDEQLRTLIQLCHPDKHGGKESAVRMTQMLNSMRKQ